MCFSNFMMLVKNAYICVLYKVFVKSLEYKVKTACKINQSISLQKMASD